MTKEQLLALGVPEAQVDGVLKLHKDTIDSSFIPKHRFDEVNGELKTVKAQLNERDTQITELKKFEGTSQELQEKLTALQQSNEEAATKFAEDLVKERKSNAVKLALLQDEEGKPFDVDMVMGLFNMDQIVLDETTGKITSGYKEQNETLRKGKSFLFEPKQEPNNPEGMKFRGNPPKDGNGSGTSNTLESYGKNLAAVKLGMMGIDSAAGD